MANDRKGIILAGGSGTRLYPLTITQSKQLLPIYSKPMIYYPLTTLMLAGMREVLIICTPQHKSQFEELLGDGSHLGMEIQYKVQPSPDGLAQAFILGAKFIGDRNSCLILGDNIFYGGGFRDALSRAMAHDKGAVVMGYPVRDPQRFGVAEISEDGRVISLEEKPEQPKSNLAVTGLYFYDENAPKYASELKPSHRGELEITDLNRMYLEHNELRLEFLGRGVAWLDTGTFESYHRANCFIEAIESRQGMMICAPEEIAWRMGYINDSQLGEAANRVKKSDYGSYLLSLLERNY